MTMIAPHQAAGGKEMRWQAGIELWYCTSPEVTAENLIFEASRSLG